jgi:hypothetical protein
VKNTPGLIRGRYRCTHILCCLTRQKAGPSASLGMTNVLCRREVMMQPCCRGVMLQPCGVTE